MMATLKRLSYLNCLSGSIHRQVLICQYFNPTLLPVYEASCSMSISCVGKPAAAHTFSQTYRCKTALMTLSQTPILSASVRLFHSVRSNMFYDEYNRFHLPYPNPPQFLISSDRCSIFCLPSLFEKVCLCDNLVAGVSAYTSLPNKAWTDLYETWYVMSCHLRPSQLCTSKIPLIGNTNTFAPRTAQ
jgi:hypothetical protein